MKSRALYKRPAEILLAEDQPGDIELIREALAREGENARLRIVGDGEAALDYLLRRGKHSAAARPDLVLLDLSLPRISGRDVLAQVKSNPGLTDIPIVILTGSESPEVICDISSLHANCYVAKPTGLEESMRVLQAVIHFWLKVARLPGQGF